MPKSGIWQQTKKIKSVMAVHSTFSRNWIFLSGFWISGSILQKGLTNSRNLTEKRKKNRENTTASNCLATSHFNFTNKIEISKAIGKHQKPKRNDDETSGIIV